MTPPASLVAGQPAKKGGREIYLRDRKQGRIEIISVTHEKTPANNLSPAISADGRFVAFQSNVAIIPSAGTRKSNDVFVRDRKEGRTGRARIDPDGKECGSWCREPVISPDGRYVAFTVAYTPFIRDLREGRTMCVDGPNVTIHGFFAGEEKK